MKISKTGINLISEFEGCYLTAYKCPAGVWTIGLGHTAPVDGVPIHAGMKITQAKAEQLLSECLEQRYEPAVRKLGQMNQNQYDALVSFCYNLGPGIFYGSLLNAIKDKNWEDVARQMKLYNKARVNGVYTELKGLTRRRHAEAELLLRPLAEDLVYKNAVAMLEKSIKIDTQSWYPLEKIELKNVEPLLHKMGGLDRLAQKKVISERLLWEQKCYTKNHVRSLIIKYALLIG